MMMVPVIGYPARGLGASAAALLAAVAMSAPEVARAADYGWSGGATSTPGSWSNPVDWAAGTAPANGETIGTVTFPAITSAACNSSQPVTACGRSTNDLTGITVGTITINDAHAANAGDTYSISGNGITLTGGLSAAPGGSVSSGAFGSSIGVPITLGVSQTWSVTGAPPISGQIYWGYGLALSAPVTGPTAALTLDLSQEGVLFLSGDNEVGPVSIVGASASLGGSFGLSSGTLGVGSSRGITGALNTSDGNPVNVSNAEIEVTGSTGPLTLTNSQLFAGSALPPAGSASVTSARFDNGSNLYVFVSRSGSRAGADYSQLTSTGPIALGGSRLGVSFGANQVGAICPAPTIGTVYTLVSTTGGLTGRFSTPDGGILDVSGIAPACPAVLPYALRINYHEIGPTQTVTGTVVPSPPAGVRPGVAAASPVSGTVLVRLRRQRGFTKLKTGQLIPTGSELDTTSGRVRVYSAGIDLAGSAGIM